MQILQLAICKEGKNETIIIEDLVHEKICRYHYLKNQLTITIHD